MQNEGSNSHFFNIEQKKFNLFKNRNHYIDKFQIIFSFPYYIKNFQLIFNQMNNYA